MQNKPLAQKSNRNVIQTLTGEQLRLLYQRANASPDAEILVLMLCTGIRPSEAIALRWQDLDMQARTLTIQRTIRMVGQIRDMTESARVLLLPQRLLERLQVHQTNQQKIRVMASTTWRECGIIFSAGTGGYCSIADLRRCFHQHLLEIGLSPNGLHVIRQSTILMLSLLDIDPRTMHALLGFKQGSLGISHLTPLTPSMTEDAIQRLMSYLTEETH